MKDLKCMSFTSKGTAEIIVAGLQNTMFVIDLIKGEVVKQVRNSYSYSQVTFSIPGSNRPARRFQPTINT